MADVKRTASRSTKSFGVAGLLGENCRVYYQNVFSPEGVGRVADLISAKLAEAGADELRVRSVLLFGFFDAYRSASDEGGGRAPLAEPVVVECGTDGERLALGFAFKLADQTAFEHEGMADRLAGEGSASNEFERLLNRMAEHSERVCVKFAPKSRRVELDAVITLGAPGAPVSAAIPEVIVLDGAAEQTPEAGGYVELGDLEYSELLKQGAGPKVEASPAGVVLAGSVEVLGDEVKIVDLRKAAEEETRASGGPAAEGSKRVADKARGDGTKTEVKGARDAASQARVAGNAAGDEATRVAGQTESDDSATRIGGPVERLGDNSKVVVKGGAPATALAAGKAAPGSKGAAEVKGLDSAVAAEGSDGRAVELYQRRISQLLERIALLEREKQVSGGAPSSAVVPGGAGGDRSPLYRVGGGGSGSPDAGMAAVSGTAEESPQPKPGAIEGAEPDLAKAEISPDQPESKPTEVAQADQKEPELTVRKVFENLLSKVWPFKKAKEEEAAQTAQPSGEPAEAAAAQAAVVKDEESGEEIDYNDVPDAASAIRSLMVEIENGGLEHAIADLKKEATDLRNKSKSPQVKRLAEEMLSELTEEKTKLYSLARKLNWSIKKREMEMRNKEVALQEELKRRDEALKKKDTLVQHTKSQLAQVNMNMERLRSSTQNAAEDQQYRKKYGHIQKLYESAKAESLKHLRELDRVKKQMASLKFTTASQQQGAGQAGELEDLKGKHERTKRQLEEFKRMNKQLIDRVGHLERQKSAAAPVRGDEVRERLDQAMKAANAARSDADALQAKVTALEKERDRSRELLKQAMEKMKKVMASRKPPNAA